MARQGGTVVMVSSVSDRKEMDESGFLPLSVDYREKVSTLCFLYSMFNGAANATVARVACVLALSPVGVVKIGRQFSRFLSYTVTGFLYIGYAAPLQSTIAWRNARHIS